MARGRTVGLGPTSGTMPGQGTGGKLAGVLSGGGTPEGHALLFLVFVELLATGWLRSIFRRAHGG